jgi:2-polyprenyl-6-hydroxyphenyl methylase/3-demethylubiquinone-9 3-methyltransferase
MESRVTGTSILADEVRQFAAHADDWWNPNGSEAMLHKLNPVRLKYVRDQIDQHWQCDECSRSPLTGRTALDVGCGAGLLAEPLARLGAKVTGLDASAALIRVAQDHARASGLAIDYRSGELAELEGQFDLITCMEVIEHVADPEAFVDLLMIKIGEGIGRIPKGTHDFAKFIAPERMKVLLGVAGLRCVDVEGIAWSPTRGLHLSDDVRLNYLVAAVRA